MHADRRRVTVTGEGADSMPGDEDNLAMRRGAALAKAAGLPPRRGPRVVSDDSADGNGRPGVGIEIRKRIPVAAGLAGGSADAAAALVACNELWQAGLSQQELAEVAAGIGSDVAFALFGGTSVGQGRGERLTPALVTGQYHWVLAFAAGGTVHRRGLPGVRPDQGKPATSRRRRLGPARNSWPRCGPVTRPRSGRCSATSFSPRRCRCAPNCAGRWPWAASTARSARWSPARGRPARSWPRTRSARWTSSSRSPGPGCAGRRPGWSGRRRARSVVSPSEVGR